VNPLWGGGEEKAHPRRLPVVARPWPEGTHGGRPEKRQRKELDGSTWSLKLGRCSPTRRWTGKGGCRGGIPGSGEHRPGGAIEGNGALRLGRLRRGREMEKDWREAAAWTVGSGARRSEEQRQPVVLGADAVECEMGKFPSALACEVMVCLRLLTFKADGTGVVGRQQRASGRGDNGKLVLGALRSNDFDTDRRLRAVGTQRKLVGIGVRTECGGGQRAHVVERGEDFDRMGRANTELGRTADAGWAQLTSFHLFKVFPNTFKCPRFEITKQILPGIQNFPNLVWFQIILNRTLFLFDPTSKSF
jgi:hypothetical protein